MDSIEHIFSVLKDELQTERSLTDQFKLYSQAISDLGCGHTQIHPNKDALKGWLAARNSLPIDYFLQGDRLFVSKIESEDLPVIHEGKDHYQRKKKLDEGTEIIAINGKTVPEMMQEIGQLLSSDEDHSSFKYFQAAHLFEFYRHLTDPFDADSVEVVCRDGNRSFSMYFQTGTAPVYTMNKRMAAFAAEQGQAEFDYGDFKIIKGKYGYFRFKSFSASYGKNYNEFLNTSFEQLRKKNVDKLVIDLRGNTGGVMQYEIMRYFVGGDQYLGRYIVAKPRSKHDSKYIKKFSADYLKHLRLSKNQKRLIRKGKFNDGKIQTAAIDDEKIFQGQIVVITDEGTFSSSSMLACHLKTLANAKIVGRPAGGSFYSGNSGTLTVKLPQSGFTMFVNPNTFYSHLEKPSNPTEIKQPDLFITPRFLQGSKEDAYYFKEATSLFTK